MQQIPEPLPHLYDPTQPISFHVETTGWIVMWSDPAGKLYLSEIFPSCEDAQQARFNPPQDSWDYRATFVYTGAGGEQSFDC